MRWSGAAVFLIAFCAYALAQEVEPPPSIEELTGNVSTSVITVLENPGPLYSGFVDPQEELRALIPTSATSLSKVQCIPPSGKRCDCRVETGGEFGCSFYPPVGGVYKINVESAKLMAYGNFSIELKKGELPFLRQLVKQETISLGTLLFGLSFLAVAVLAYAAYFIYKLAMRKRDALRSLYDERQKVEDDMKVLRYRFFKREIDANTYNTVFKQKEQELAVVNANIIKMLKSKGKAKELPAE